MSADPKPLAGAESSRDAALRLALSHAPDRDLHAPAVVREALQRAARQAVAEARPASPVPEARPPTVPGDAAVPAAIASRLRRGGAMALSWLAQGLRPPALGGLASLAVAGLALHLWMAQEGPVPAGALEPAAPTSGAAAPPSLSEPTAAVAPADTDAAPSVRPPPAAIEAARVHEPRRAAAPARPVDATPQAAEAPAPALTTAPPLPAAAPTPAAAVARPPAMPSSPMPVSDQAGHASPPSGPALAKAAPAPAGTRAESGAAAPEATAPQVATAAAPAADQTRVETALATEAQASTPSSPPAQATAALGRARTGLMAAPPLPPRTGAMPPPLQRLAEALRDPAATAAGWTVAEAGGAARPMDDATRAWWRQLIRTSAGRWVALAPDAASAALAGETGGEAWAVTAPEGSRFTLRQTPGHWLLLPAPAADGAGGAGGPPPWRASRRGPSDRAASTAP